MILFFFVQHDHQRLLGIFILGIFILLIQISLTLHHRTNHPGRQRQFTRASSRRQFRVAHSIALCAREPIRTIVM